MKKKILAFIIAVVSVLTFGVAFSACGGGNVTQKDIEGTFILTEYRNDDVAPDGIRDTYLAFYPNQTRGKITLDPYNLDIVDEFNWTLDGNTVHIVFNENIGPYNNFDLIGAYYDSNGNCKADLKYSDNKLVVDRYDSDRNVKIYRKFVRYEAENF